MCKKKKEYGYYLVYYLASRDGSIFLCSIVFNILWHTNNDTNILFKFIERWISQERYFHIWSIVEDTWWKPSNQGYKNESWIIHGIQLVFSFFYKIPSSVSVTRTHVLTEETWDENHIVLLLKYHMKGQTRSQHLVEL